MNAKTVNGFEVVASEKVPRTKGDRQGYIIIVDRGATTFQRYVASLYFDGEDGWAQGHYCSELESAREEMAELVALYGPTACERNGGCAGCNWGAADH